MTIEELLEDWHRRTYGNQFAHYESAKLMSRYHLMLGIPVIVLSSILGTSIFASLNNQPAMWIRILAGIVSLLAAMLAALQTFLGFSERAEKHRVAGATFGTIRREIEQMQAMPEEMRGDMKAFLDQLREKFDAIAQQSPEIPDHIWSLRYRRLKKDDASRRQ